MEKRLGFFYGLAVFAIASTAALAADYQTWATGHFGAAIVSDPAQQASVWGHSADPDLDGLPNLLEYTGNLDPTEASDRSELYGVELIDHPDHTGLRLVMTTWQRSDDPDLVVLPQISADLTNWQPFTGGHPAAWWSDPAVIETIDTGEVRGVLRKVLYVTAAPIPYGGSAFLRLATGIDGTGVTGPALYPVSLTGQPFAPTATVIQSNQFIAGGFVGSVTMTVPAGVRIFVNGEDRGASTTINPGDRVWLESETPAAAGQVRNHTVDIGNFTTTWNIGTRAITPIPDHPGEESGYTQVQTNVSETGAAQISIPIAVAPGVAGMEPKLAINYSSQGGNGMMGNGFSLSGLSGISRTGASYAQDGFKGSISFGADDRFSLDGQRLVAIVGPDGGDGTEYRTEMDSFSRIESQGSGNDGPTSFTVETKSGLVTEYSTAVKPIDRRSIGKVRCEVYLNIPGGSIADLENAPSFPGSPNETLELQSLARPAIGDNYGQRVTGFIIPPATGQYTLLLSSDLSSRLRLNLGTQETPDIVELTAALNITSISVSLEAGRYYEFEILHKEDGGNDGFGLYWEGPTIPAREIIAGEFISISDPNISTGTTPTLSWLPTRTSDTFGNSIEYSYDSAGLARGEALLTSINYTTANLESSGQQVVFEYEDRPELRVAYVGGAEIRTTKRLTTIDSRSGGHFVRRYEFDYRDSKMSNGFLLTSVRDIDPSGVIRPTNFEWLDEEIPVYTSSETPIPAAIGAAFHHAYTVTGDFNGDGVSDLFCGGNDGDLILLLRVPGPQFVPVRSSPDKGFNRAAMWLGDFNADGMTDVLTRPSGATKFVVYFSNGDGTFLSTEFDQSEPWNSGKVILGDFDGDGRTDVLTGVEGNTWRCFLSNGDGTFEVVAEMNSWPWNGSTVLPGDFNGDGLTDLLSHNGIHIGSYSWVVMLSDGDGTFTQSLFSYPTRYGNGHGGVPPVVGDFNGDGITEVMGVAGTKLIVFLFDGRGGVEMVETDVGISGFDFRGDAVCSFNSDRTTDLLAYFGNGGQIIRFTGKENGEMGVRIDDNPTPWYPDGSLWIGDFDGDGKGELTSTFHNFSHFESASSAEDLVSVVRKGNGSSTSFTYKPLTNSTVYERTGEGVTYPCHEFQTSLYVVDSIEATNGLEIDPFDGSSSGAPTTSRQTFFYKGAWTCLDGRGFQGFKEVQTTDERSGVTTATRYDDRPLTAGRPLYSSSRLADGRIIQESENTWGLDQTIHPNGNKTYFVRNATSISREFEISNQPANGGQPYKTTTSSGSLYDGFGNLLSMTVDYGGGYTERTVNTYDNITTGGKWHLGRLRRAEVTKTAPDCPTQSRCSSFAYHPVTGVLVSETIEPESGVHPLEKTYIHDVYGNITESRLRDLVTDETRITKTRYSADKRFVEETENALGHTENKTYDPLLGNVLTQTGPNGLTTAWEYDPIGRPLRELRADGTETRTFYRKVTAATANAPPRAVHYVRTQSSGGSPSTTWFDLLDREIARDAIGFDGRTVRSHMVYNDRGEVTHQSQPFYLGDVPIYTVTEFDPIGRSSRQIAPGDRVTRTVYDGLTVSVTNPNEQTMTRISDVLGRTVDSADNADQSVTFTRDAFGNLRFVTDPAGNRTEMRYDIRGNKLWMSEPNSGITTYQYNAFGELRSQRDAKNQTVSLRYDRLGRLVQRDEPEGRTSWEYDSAPKGIGKLARVYTTGSRYERQHRYDTFGRPSGTFYTHGSRQFAVSSAFDFSGRPDTLTYPTGFSVRNVYNIHGHLAEVQNALNPATKYWTAMQVNARGQVEDEFLGNGLYTQRSFEPERGLLKTIQTGRFHGSEIQNLGYQFDDIGNLLQRRDLRQGEGNAFVEDFEYDDVNRLDRYDTTGALSVLVSYDALGNIASRTDIGVYNYGQNGAGPNAVTSITGSFTGKNNTYTHDANGNRIASADTTLSYSSFNKPTSIRKGTSYLFFEHAPDRSRYQQTQINGVATTVKDYIGGLFEREAESEGTVRNIHYIRGGSGVIAIHTSTQNTGGDAGALKTRYLHRDHLGSVESITDENGNLSERFSYDAWGQRRSVTFSGGNWAVADYTGTPSETNRGFTGHEMLDAVGLIHMNGRVYDPVIGRFLSPDPFVQAPENLQSLNRYSYVLNNPLSFTDPSGFFFKSVLKFLKKHWRTIAAVAVGVVTAGAFLYGAAAILGQTAAIGANGGFFGAIFSSNLTALGGAVVGAGLGFGSAFSGTLLAGGSVGDALRAGLKGGVVGAATGSINAQINRSFPSWLKTAPGEKRAWLTSSRLVNHTKRMMLRAGTSGVAAELSGGKFRTAFLQSTGLDAITLTHEMFVENRYRWEVSRPGSKLRFSRSALRNMESQGFAQGRGVSRKPTEYISVIDPTANNFGIPSIASASSRGFWQEGGYLSSFANKIPGMNQLSIGHDFFATAFEFRDSGMLLQSLGKGLNISSMPVYFTYTYGRWGMEARNWGGYQTPNKN